MKGEMEMKKTAILFIAVLLLISTTSGCTEKNTPAPSEGTEPVALSILSLGDTWNPDNAFLELIEEATNTKLDMQIVPVDEYEVKRNIVMASGNTPNIIRIKYQDPLFMSYINEGKLLPLDEYLDKFPKVKNTFDSEIWDNNKAEDGKIYHIPRIDAEVLPNLLMLRKDVLDDLGLSVPKTTDELRQVLETLKNANDEKGYTPYVGNRNDLTDIDPFFYAFGTGVNIWQEADDGSGKIVFSATTEKFRDAIKYVSELRRDGLFETEWYVGTNRGIDKFYTGKAEFTMDSPQYVEYRIPDVQKVDEDAVIDYIPEFTAKDGSKYGAVIRVNEQVDPGSAVVKGTTPEQIDAFMGLLEWFYDGDGYTMLKYGVEGKTYDVVDGKMKGRPRDQNPPEYDMENMDRFDFAYTPQFRAFTRDMIPDVVSDAQFDIARKAIDKAFESPIINYASNLNDPVIADNLNNLQSLAEELITKAILTPDVDIDALFTEYNQKFKQNKLDEVTEAVNRLNAP